MTTVVVDTNVLIRLFKGDDTVAKNIAVAEKIIVPVAVLGEFLSGVSNPNSSPMIALHQFLALPFVELVGSSKQTAQHYSTIYRQLKASGTPIPINDIWILAEAKNQHAAIYSFDAHFDFGFFLQKCG